MINVICSYMRGIFHPPMVKPLGPIAGICTGRCISNDLAGGGVKTGIYTDTGGNQHIDIGIYT